MSHAPLSSHAADDLTGAIYELEAVLAVRALGVLVTRHAARGGTDHYAGTLATQLISLEKNKDIESNILLEFNVIIPHTRYIISTKSSLFWWLNERYWQLKFEISNRF